GPAVHEQEDHALRLRHEVRLLGRERARLRRAAGFTPAVLGEQGRERGGPEPVGGSEQHLSAGQRTEHQAGPRWHYLILPVGGGPPFGTMNLGTASPAPAPPPPPQSPITSPSSAVIRLRSVFSGIVLRLIARTDPSAIATLMTSVP